MRSGGMANRIPPAPPPLPLTEMQAMRRDDRLRVAAMGAPDGADAPARSAPMSAARPPHSPGRKHIALGTDIPAPETMVDADRPRPVRTGMDRQER